MARHTRTIRVTKIASGYRISIETDGRETSVNSHRADAPSALKRARELQRIESAMGSDRDPQIVWDASGRRK